MPRRHQRAIAEETPMSKKDLETTRRAALGVMAAFSAVAASGAPQTAQAQTAQKTFVLVHGTWDGGWSWRPVADPLERNGVNGQALSLPGVGDRSHLLPRAVNLPP